MRTPDGNPVSCRRFYSRVRALAYRAAVPFSVLTHLAAKQYSGDSSVLVGWLRMARTHRANALPSGPLVLTPNLLRPFLDEKRVVFNPALGWLEGAAHEVEIGLRRGRAESLDNPPPSLQPALCGRVVDYRVGFGAWLGAHEQTRVDMQPDSPAAGMLLAAGSTVGAVGALVSILMCMCECACVCVCICISICACACSAHICLLVGGAVLWLRR